MKLFLATMAYLVMTVLFCAGILLMMHGKPAMLIGVAAVYLVVFGKVGCASQ